MHSVADDVRQAHRGRSLALAPEERMRLALELGEEALQLICHRQGIDRSTAVRLVQRQRQIGRRHSRCLLEALA